MPTNELAKQADAVRADIAKLEADLKTLLHTIGGAVGAAVSGRIREPMQAISAHVEPLLNMLGAAAGDAPVPFKRGPGRPKTAEGLRRRSRVGVGGATRRT